MSGQPPPSKTRLAPAPPPSTTKGIINSSGNALSGLYPFQFAIYDAESEGNLIWGTESHVDVSVSDGLFSVGLGSQTEGGIPATTWNGDRYLEITVDGETLTPRELIRSVPIAGMALKVQEEAVEKPTVKTEVHRVRAKIPGHTMGLTDTPEIIPGTQITLTASTTDINYVMYITADFILTNSISTAGLYIDEVPAEQGQAIFKSQFGGRGTVSQTYVVPVSAGMSKKVDLRANLVKVLSEDDKFTAQITGHTSMTYIAVPQ